MTSGLWEVLQRTKRVMLTEPLGYVAFMSLVFSCQCVLTDSGGIQEETTYLGTPCLTMRITTERPITITEGTNRLVSLESMEKEFLELHGRRGVNGKVPEFRDGGAANRVVASIKRHADAK